MTYLSICSGIEAATVAWKPLGFTPVGFAEIGNSMAVPVMRWIGERIKRIQGEMK